MIPVLIARGKTLPEAYENSLIELYRNGGRVKTQYDKEGELLSIDATMNITIEEPETEPMIYKIFPGGIEDLREYVIELQGAKDHWVKCINDPEDHRWEYTYHQRLADWGTYYIKDFHGVKHKINYKWDYDENAKGIDQFEVMVKKLIESPFTRRAQAITWMPFQDNEVYDPPCLQSIWCRLTDESDGTLALNANIRFRSNDAWGAAFMNMFGLTMLIRLEIANPVEEGLGKPVKLGRINWQADSYHVYGKDIDNFKKRLIERYNPFTLAARVFYFNDPNTQEIWKKASIEVKEKIQKFDEEHK